MIEISGYKIIKPLGKGGMSTVYLALQESVSRNVALKVMSSHLISDESYAARFLREARIAARLIHPNIISILDVNMANGLPYIAMEYAPGGELSSERIASLQLKGQLRVLVQIASALEFLHQQNYLHRDIKPSNILFREDNTAVLTDFGVAIDQSSDSRVTLAGYIIGTPHYMSPEQALGGVLDTRADIYSLGVLVYRVLAGRVPFTAENAIGICQKHVSEPVPDLPHKYAMFDHVVKKAMAKSPGDRHESAAEFINELIDATGKDTARMLRQALLRDDFEALPQVDEGNTTQLQPPDAPGSRSTRIEPTFGGATRNLQPPASKPPDHTQPISAAGSEHDLSWKSRLSSTYREQPGLVLGGLAGILTVLVILALIIGNWRPGRDGPTSTQAYTIELAEAERLVETGLPANIHQARSMYRDILSKDARNETAAEGLRKLAGHTASGSVPVAGSATSAEPPGAVVANEVEPGPASIPPSTPNPEDDTIQQLLARGQATMNALTLPAEADPSPSSDFREVLIRDPGNRDALLALDELASRLLLMAEASIESGDIDATGRLLKEIKLTGSGDIKRLAVLELNYEELTDSRAKRATEINDLLARGEKYLQSDNLTKPPGASALEAFRQVLDLDAGNQVASEGANRVGQRFLELSKRALDQGDWQKAEEYWQNADEVVAGLKGADLLRQQLDQHQKDVAVQQQAQSPAPAAPRPDSAGLPPGDINPYRFENLGITGSESADTLFNMAESQLNSGSDLRAYGLYREVIRKDPSHAGARKRLSRGAGVYLKFADRDIIEGDLNSAYRNLQIAFALDADDAKADAIRRAYLTARDDRVIHANPGDEGTSGVEAMQINLALQDAKAHHARFRADPGNHTAGLKAIEFYQRVLNIQSYHPAAKTGLNALLDELISASENAFDQNQTDEAFWFYKRALDINPNDPRLTQLEARWN